MVGANFVIKTSRHSQLKMYNISIVIACYNEEKILKESVKEIEKVMNQTKYSKSYELIFVDDCSKDKTRQLIEDITTDKPNMSYIFHEKNTGKGGSVVDGLTMSNGKIVGFLDIDLEVHARYIPSFISAVEDGYDMVNGSRIYTLELTINNILRHLLSVGYRWLTRHYIGLPFRDTQCGFKFFNKEAMISLIEQTKNQGWVWDTEIMALAYNHNKKIKEIPCIFSRRKDKKSTLSVWKDTWKMGKGLRELKKNLNENA